MSIRTRFEACLLVCALALAPVVARAAGDASEADDPELQQYRERFKQGLDRYEANDVAGALSFWEPLYRDLGPSRGYRVGYNLARAYEVFGDATRAAERYESFLDEVNRRHAQGKPLDELVSANETKARARLDEITRTRGRIRVAPTTPPASVRIDQTEPRLAGFVAYVAPGPHDVTFAPGSKTERAMHVDVQAGQVVELALPEPPPPSPAFRETTKHPFPPAVLWVAGAATLLVGGGLTGGAYANAVIVHDHYASQPPNIGPTQAQVTNYENARTLAYASWAVPAALGLATAVLVIWYAAGTKHTRVPLTGALSF